MELVRATMTGTSYEIDLSFFSSHIVPLWVISKLAIASANEIIVLSD